ncbi:hypothetical protein PAMP_005661 [Pampus punctatissimus]
MSRRQNWRNRRLTKPGDNVNIMVVLNPGWKRDLPVDHLADLSLFSGIWLSIKAKAAKI